MVSSSWPGSSKRLRPLSQVALCSVDGCVYDLSKCREYHRRHKVCEAHSKTAIVMVGGREQRFCQQCSRFHLLVEFDEVKRSCRKRLDGHNRRRRKTQLDFLNSGRSFTNHQGISFDSSRQVLPTTPPKSEWPTLIKAEEDRPLGADGHFPLSSSGSYKGAKQFPFQLKPASAFASSSSGERALSLLSSSAARISRVDLSSVASQSLVPGLHFVGHDQCSSSPVGNMQVSDITTSDFDSHGLFHIGLEGSSELPFSWH